MHNHETLELFREDKFFKEVHARLNEAKKDDDAAKWISKPGLKNKKPKDKKVNEKGEKDEPKKKTLSPEQKEMASMEKEAAGIVKKGRDNFKGFLKGAGDNIKKVVKFWENQGQVVERLASKYPGVKVAYAPIDSNFIYAVQNVEGTEHLIVIKKQLEGEEKNPYISIATKNGVNEFRSFLMDMKKELQEYKEKWQGTVEKQKKEKEQVIRKQKLEKVLKEGEEAKDES